VRHEPLQIIEALKIVADPLVVDLGVLVNQHVVKADRLATALAVWVPDEIDRPN
jgi:hypothetical protein